MSTTTQADRLGVNADEYKGDQSGAFSGGEWVTIYEALNWPADEVPHDGPGVYARFLGQGDTWVVLQRRNQ